jgi:hypothetical protein
MLSKRLFLSTVSLTATCFDYTNVYELNDGFGGPEILRSMEQVRHRHRPRYHPTPLYSKKPLQLGSRGRGNGEATGMIRLEGGELYHNGTHGRSLLI